MSFDVFAGPTTGYNGGVDFYLGSFLPANLVFSDLEGNRAKFNYSFVATSASTAFTFVSNGGNVSHIDNVALATPAPSAMVAFALGAARLRRRRK